MAQAMDKSTVQDAPAAEKRIEELESVLRIVLEQINTHQIYEKDARGLIRRALSSTSRTGPRRRSDSRANFRVSFLHRRQTLSRPRN